MYVIILRGVTEGDVRREVMGELDPCIKKGTLIQTEDFVSEKEYNSMWKAYDRWDRSHHVVHSITMRRRDDGLIYFEVDARLKME